MMTTFQRRSRGFSLIEMLIVIVVTSTIVGAACTMLVATVRTNEELSAQLLQRQTFDRLDKQLRRDLAVATSVKLVPDTDEGGSEMLLLASGDAKIEYRADAKRLTRRELTAAGEVVRTEKYAWSQPMLPRWQIDESGVGKVTLTFAVANDESPLSPAWQALSISGTVGSDHRFEKPQER